MNVHALIPLIATIAYIPLFVILFSNRPWGRKQKFLLLFLISAFLWSFTDFLSRSDFLTQNKLFEVKFVLCITIWMLAQFHYFICSFYRSEHVRIPLAYVFPASAIVLAVLGYIPRGVEITTSGIHVDYGIWIIAIGFLFLFTVGARDIYSLLRRFKISPDPAERNQIIYLLGAIAILTVFLLAATAPFGERYPVAHIGNLLNAGVLTYAVVRHKLLDVRVVFRQALSFTGMAIFVVVTFFAWFLLLLKAFGLGLGFPIIIIAMLGTLAVAAVCWDRVHNKIFGRVDRVFYGERFEPR
ncbi:MAG: hypothetical protein COS87_01290, partial [Chloroflexi bacterium CG07_land_8_20_14_0_80_45_17]